MFHKQYSAGKVEILFNVPAKLALNKYQKHSERKNDNILILSFWYCHLLLYFRRMVAKRKSNSANILKLMIMTNNFILIRRKYWFHYSLCNKNQIVSIMHTRLFRLKWTQCPACNNYINTLIIMSYILLIVVWKKLSGNALLSAIYKRNY